MTGELIVVNMNVMTDPYEAAKQVTVEYWRHRAEEAEKEVARLQEAWQNASDLIAACQKVWAAMEKLG